MGHLTVLALLLLTLIAAPAWSFDNSAFFPSDITDVRQDGSTGSAGSVSLQNSNELLTNCWACGEQYLSNCCDFPVPVFTQNKIYIRFNLGSFTSGCLHSATLSLKKVSGADPTSSPFNIINVRSVDWDGSPLNWATAAALTVLSSAPPQNFVFSKTDSRYSLSIPLSFIDAALLLSSPVLALEIQLSNGGVADVSTLFNSTVSPNGPDLSVQYTALDCASNSHCYAGSCVCDTGYAAASNGTCLPVKNCPRLSSPSNPVCVHGTCSEVSAPNPIGAVSCACASGWFGTFCDANVTDADVNECRFKPCRNGGSCTDTVGSFTCACPLGWGGALCDEPAYCAPVTGFPPTRTGQTAVGVCPPGTTSDSPPTRYCNEGTLTLDPPTITCTAVVCAEVNVNNPSVSTKKWAGATAGGSSAGECNDGFESPNAERGCDSSGNLSPTISNPCTPKFCPAETKGNADFPKTPAGVIAYGNCSTPGYYGYANWECTADGWAATGNGTECVQQTSATFCPASIDAHGFVLFPKSVTGPIPVQGRCPPGTLGTPTRVCSGSDWATTITNPCYTLPLPVTNLRVKSQFTSQTSTAQTAVTLTWTPATGAGIPAPTRYQVMYYDSNANKFTFVNNGGGDSWDKLSIDVDFLDPRTSYVMIVYAGTEKGYETVGTMVSFVTNAPTVVSCNATVVGTTGATLTWGAIDGAQWYTVMVRYVGPSASKRAITSTSYVVADGGLKITALSFTFTNLGVKSGYQALIMAGATVNGVDSMASTGIEVLFHSLGYVAPTAAPTATPVGPTDPTPTANIVPYVAGGVGGAVALLLFVVILVAFFVRSKRKEKELYQLQMAELPPAEAWGQSATSLVSRAGGTQTLTRTHTLTRPNAGLDGGGAGLSLHSLNSTNGDMMFGADPTLMNTVMEISLPGFLLLDYAKDLRIVNRFGNGGSGVVYRAVLLDPKLRKQHNVEEVALKEVVAWEKLSHEENMERFHQEVSLLWSLAFHRNIATLIGYTDSPPTIVTKLYETDLFQFLQNPDEEVTIPIAVLLASQIAAGISGMHNIGIVHRDIKSANVLLETVTTQSGILLNACLCDFGLARVTATSKLFNQKFSTVVGLSPRYAAPEVFARSHLPTLVPDPEEEKKADVFAFGVVVWELMTRQIPWDDTPNEQIEVRVRSGKRLVMPPVNGDLLIQTMSDISTASWIEQPARRPNIQDIHKRLNSLEL